MTHALGISMANTLPVHRALSQFFWTTDDVEKLETLATIVPLTSLTITDFVVRECTRAPTCSETECKLSKDLDNYFACRVQVGHSLCNPLTDVHPSIPKDLLGGGSILILSVARENILIV
jgi:hypothetical protein